MSRIAILGGGSWGTGLSVVLTHSRRKHEIRIWARELSVAQSIQENRVNPDYLPGLSIPASVQASNDLEEVLRDAQIVVGVVPSAHARAVYVRAVPYITSETAIVSATKGLEPATHLRMSEVIAQVFALRFIPRTAVLSGPSFALEASRGDPTAVVLASQDRALAAFLQEEFSGPTFRLYTNDDVLGTELAGEFFLEECGKRAILRSQHYGGRVATRRF